MKQWTTPTIKIKLDGQSDLLATAQRIIITGKGNRRMSADYDATVDGDTVSCILSQEDTGKIGGGVVEFEVTIRTQTGAIVKSETVSGYIDKAIRQYAFDEEAEDDDEYLL